MTVIMTAYYGLIYTYLSYGLVLSCLQNIQYIEALSILKNTIIRIVEKLIPSIKFYHRQYI